MIRTAIFVAAMLAAAAPAMAQQEEAAAYAAAAPDYALGQNWLCLPGRRDACTVPLATTDIAADGTVTRSEHRAAGDPAFDCFYVYPTVSDDPTPNSDLVDNDEERRVIMLQAAPFQQACRVFAPLYRQVTLTDLRRGIATGTFSGDRTMAYRDVLAAWNEYLANHNDGRGVALIGHSQGAGVLANLIAEEIDGEPVADRLVSALLIGSNLAVPEGADVGGRFQSVPLCREAGQTGCAVSFVSFRADVPPPASSRFGRVEGEGMAAACVSPAALAGNGEALDAWLSNSSLLSSSEPLPWTSDDPEIGTNYVRVPGLLSARCVERDGFSYLAVAVAGDPADPRTDDIAGDVVVGGQRLDDWGLHLIDMNLAMGDMVRLVEAQGAACVAAHASE